MNNILKNKTNNIIALAFSCVYAVMTVLNFEFNSMLFKNFRYAINTLLTDGLSLLLPVSLIVFIALKNKDFSFKKWLLPIVFGITLIKNTAIVFANFINNFTAFEGKLPAILWLMLISSILMLISFTLMFIGTLFDFKYVCLLKYGALSGAILTLLPIIIEFIRLGGFKYIQSIPSQYWTISIKSLISALSLILFYIGFFIPTTDKAETEKI